MLRNFVMSAVLFMDFMLKIKMRLGSSTNTKSLSFEFSTWSDELYAKRTKKISKTTKIVVPQYMRWTWSNHKSPRTKLCSFSWNVSFVAVFVSVQISNVLCPFLFWNYIFNVDKLMVVRFRGIQCTTLNNKMERLIVFVQIVFKHRTTNIISIEPMKSIWAQTASITQQQQKKCIYLQQRVSLSTHSFLQKKEYLYFIYVHMK